MSLFDLVLEKDELAELDPAQRRLAIRDLISSHTPPDRFSAAVSELADAIDGYGPLSGLMRDDAVTDVLANGPADVWVERAGRLERAGVAFGSQAELTAFIDRMFAASGGRIDLSRPMADTRLQDGSRLHVVLPPLAPNGPLVSIRRFPPVPMTIDDLVRRDTLEAGQADLLVECVKRRTTIAITGGTGTGKTTLLNALLGHVGPSERVVIVEETPELRPDCGHWVSLVARPPNVEGKGAVPLAELVRSALRMRPDRIVVGEVRGGEALAALTAMSTGHAGSMVTLHARSADDALDRMVTLCLEGSPGAAEDTLRRCVSASFGLVVHLERNEERRTVAEVRLPG